MNEYLIYYLQMAGFILATALSIQILIFPWRFKRIKSISKNRGFISKVKQKRLNSLEDHKYKI